LFAIDDRIDVMVSFGLITEFHQIRTGTRSKIFELKKILELGTNQKLTVDFGPGYLKPGV
jgi:hypothetical protein